MSKIDKWNRFAKRKIYINESLEITAGKLVYVLIFTFLQALILLLTGANTSSYAVLVGNAIFSIKQKKKEDKE